MRQFAAPLKVSASSKSEATSAGAPSTAPLGPAKVDDITSPHELTVFVEQLLTQIEGKFDDMSTQILDRMNAMSTRVDALEASIQDIINSDLQQPTTPGTPGTK